MAGLDVATDNTVFGTGQAGELKLRGPNTGAAWPFSADMATWNGLHADPANGLWVSRRDVVAINMGHTVSGGGTDVTKGTKYTWPIQNVTVTNGNAAQTMLLLVHYHWRWECNLRAGAIADMQGSLTHDNATPSWRHIGTDRSSGTDGSGDFDWIQGYAETDILTLAPGAATTFYIGVQVVHGGTIGTIDANSATVSVRGIGITYG